MRRPGLVEDLLDARGSLLALIVAPAGYGKSTLLTEWAERDERPFTWLAPRRPLSRRSSLRQRSSRGTGDELAKLVREVRLRHESFVMVLDDAHQIDGALLREFVDPALEELPPESTIALASRTEPSLPVGRLRANRLLFEIRVQQLAMTQAEAKTLLRYAGIDIDAEAVQELVQRTDGWPAALYLAALAHAHEGTGLEDFGGQHHLLAEYLRDEVLDALPTELLRFSQHTSVLDELSGAICDAVLEGRGTAAVLSELARTNALLQPIDSSHHRYRWHPLMIDVFRSELRRSDPQLEPVLRARASRWYSAHGDAEGAIDQTAAAGDAEATGDLLWQNILFYLTQGQRNRVRSWLENFRPDQIAGNAPLALSASLSALLAGDPNTARQWSLAASARLQQSSSKANPRSLAIELAVIEVIDARHGLDHMAKVASGTVKSEPQDSLWRPLCLLLSAVAAYLRGEQGDAEGLLEDAAGLSGNRAPMITSLCLAQRTMIAVEREEWELATELVDHATLLVEEWDLSADPLSAIVYAAAAASRAHDGNMDEAKRDLRRGIDLLATLGDFIPWYGAQSRILLAHAALSLADAVGARTLLAEASRFARRTPDAVVFSRWFDRAWAYLDELAEASLAGPSSLTIAELRILRFLPSHRSFREIAAQLGVSANTVKTQAHAVYRKLGAASRSEAVAQAIDAGLLWR